jgi:hypothetical protein
LELTGRSLFAQDGGWFRRVTDGDTREGIPLVRELEWRTTGTLDSEDNPVNDLLIPELKIIKQMSH